MTDRTNLQFRVGKSEDIETLVKINTDGDEEYRAINQAMFHELIKKQLVFIAEQNNVVVGLLYWRTEFLGRFNQWYLEQITVRNDARGKGIGVRLLRYFLGFAKEKGVEKVFADIHNDNYTSLQMALNAGGLISGSISGINNKTNDQRVIVRFELRNQGAGNV